jgi:hypothetical protein
VAETKDRLIIFTHGTDRILEAPFDGYEPGDIKEAREKLAEELHCKARDIEVKITGVGPSNLRIAGAGQATGRKKGR